MFCVVGPSAEYGAASAYSSPYMQYSSTPYSNYGYSTASGGGGLLSKWTVVTFLPRYLPNLTSVRSGSNKTHVWHFCHQDQRMLMLAESGTARHPLGWLRGRFFNIRMERQRRCDVGSALRRHTLQRHYQPSTPTCCYMQELPISCRLLAWLLICGVRITISRTEPLLDGRLSMVTFTWTWSGNDHNFQTVACTTYYLLIKNHFQHT